MGMILKLIWKKYIHEENNRRKNMNEQDIEEEQNTCG